MKAGEAAAVVAKPACKAAKKRYLHLPLAALANVSWDAEQNASLLSRAASASHKTALFRGKQFDFSRIPTNELINDPQK